MRQYILYSACALMMICTACQKDKSTPPANNFASREQNVLSDFASKLAVPNYKDINDKAAILNQSIQLLSTTTTDVNLKKSQTDWRNVRQAWEQCEGYLFGPVEDFNYDPAMDDWPVNKTDFDSLMASSVSFNPTYIDGLPTSLKGFHAMEYIIFGVGSSRKASEINSRQLEYLKALSENLYSITSQLYNSWNTANPANFSNELVKAGNGSQRFTSKKDAFLAIAASLSGICDEVANGKMDEPLKALDSTLQESQFSHNSTADFKNNITGVLNAYMCKYHDDGVGLNELVAANNVALDVKIQSQINAAINSFNNIDADYGKAIFNQRVQIQNTQNAIRALQETIDNDLTNYIIKYVKD